LDEETHPEVWERLHGDYLCAPQWMRILQTEYEASSDEGYKIASDFQMKNAYYNYRRRDSAAYPQDYEDNRQSLINREGYCKRAIRELKKTTDTPDRNKTLLEYYDFLCDAYATDEFYDKSEALSATEEYVNMAELISDRDTENGLDILVKAYSVRFKTDIYCFLLRSDKDLDERHLSYIQILREKASRTQRYDDFIELAKAYQDVSLFYQMLFYRTAEDEEKAVELALAAHNLILQLKTRFSMDNEKMLIWKIEKSIRLMLTEFKQTDITALSHLEIIETDFDPNVLKSGPYTAHEYAVGFTEINQIVRNILGETYYLDIPWIERGVYYLRRETSSTDRITEEMFRNREYSEMCQVLIATYYIKYWASEETKKKFCEDMVIKAREIGKDTRSLLEERKDRRGEKNCYCIQGEGEIWDIDQMGVEIGDKLICKLDPNIQMIYLGDDLVFYQGFDKLFYIGDKLLSQFKEYTEDDIYKECRVEGYDSYQGDYVITNAVLKYFEHK